MQTSAEIAKTNLQSWLNIFGAHPQWAQYRHIDSIGTIVFLVALCIIILPPLVKKLRQNKGKNQTAHHHIHYRLTVVFVPEQER